VGDPVRLSLKRCCDLILPSGFTVAALLLTTLLVKVAAAGVPVL
jgi:hypothetical protein